MGPLLNSNSFTYLLTCIDRFTRWPEGMPIRDITAETVEQSFVQCWISRFGVPSTVTTNRGTQFESALWNNLMQLLGCQRIRTTSYHPHCERHSGAFPSAVEVKPEGMYVDNTQWDTYFPWSY